MDFTSNQIVAWLRQRATVATARGFVVGLSGGVDSAVVVGLCQRALPGQVLGLIMPCGSDTRDEADAQLVADQFAVPAVRVDLEPAYDALLVSARTALDRLPPEMARPPVDDVGARVPLANIRPRLRMTARTFSCTATREWAIFSSCAIA